MIKANSPDTNIKIILGIDVNINDNIMVTSKTIMLKVFGLMSFNSFRPVLNIKKTTATLIPFRLISFRKMDIK